MSSRQHFNRLALSLRINNIGKIVHPYSRYYQSNSEYRLLISSQKCGNYTRKGIRYNVRNVTKGHFKKIDKERERLEGKLQKSREAMRKAIARIERFERLREALSKREEDLIRRSLDNIEELERLEDEERAVRGSSEVPFDPITALEQFSSETPIN